MNQTYNIYQDEEVNRQNAEKYVEEKFRKPLYAYKFPPRADVCFEGKCWLIPCQSLCRLDGSTFNLWADLHLPESGKHQDQVKVLIEKTASSLDDTALKMLFVSVQQNNVELCIRYAIDQYVMFFYCWWDLMLAFPAWLERSDSGVPFVLIAIEMTVRFNIVPESCDLGHNVLVWALICGWILNLLNWVLTLYKIDTSKSQNSICKCAPSLKIIIN